MTSLKTSIKTITYLSDIGCLEILGASLGSYCREWSHLQAGFIEDWKRLFVKDNHLNYGYLLCCQCVTARLSAFHKEKQRI